MATLSNFTVYLFIFISLSFITSNTLDKNINIYPNPTQGLLFISGLIKKERYSILDFSGREITTGIANPSQEINVSKLVPGNYILMINNKTYKFIKK